MRVSLLSRDDFRKAYKEENPDSKGVKEVYSLPFHFKTLNWHFADFAWFSLYVKVAKQGGEKWKSMTDEVSLFGLFPIFFHFVGNSTIKFGL